jgi:hypothetical protein
MNMIKILLVAGTASLLFACNSADKTTEEKKENTSSVQAVTLTDEEKKDGWQLLFDGVSTKGWHKYGGAAVGSAWKVTDGVLWLDTSSKEKGKVVGGGSIVTDEQFENFDLKLEWNIAKGGNSGIIWGVNEDTTKYEEPYDTGPEMQVLDNVGHADGKFPKHHAGDLYDLIACSKETVKPYGEWNVAEIKLLNGKLDLYLNGENVVSTTMWDDNWKKLVANSKFKDWPGFGAYKKGGISLQDHECNVSFRNIKIKKL